MAQYMRVIPNDLYNDLLEKGLLDNSQFFPASTEKPIDVILSKIPQALKNDSKQLLEVLSLQVRGNTVLIANKSVPLEEFCEKVTSFILGKGSLKRPQDFITHLIPTIKKLSQKKTLTWRTFENIKNGS